MQRVLVAGGAGFLGSHLCERLLADGYEVLCLDNFFTGCKEVIRHLLGNPRFELIRHDITIPLSFEADIICNLACPASPAHYQRNPIKTTCTSVLGVLNLLEQARKLNATIFQASTSEVYGDPLEHPQSELYRGSVNPIGTRSCYDEGKRCAESLFFDYHRYHGVNVKVARIFNTYGPRMNPQDGRVVSNFIVQALTGQSITIYGDGSQTRSFCYVDDLIDGFMKLLRSGNSFSGPVNLGNPGEFTILELARKILALTGGTGRLIQLPLPEDDPRKRCPDISLAKKELSWHPTTSLDEGLKRTVLYFEELLRRGDAITVSPGTLQL